MIHLSSYTNPLLLERFLHIMNIGISIVIDSIITMSMSSDMVEQNYPRLLPDTMSSYIAPKSLKKSAASPSPARRNVGMKTKEATRNWMGVSPVVTAR